MSEENFSLDRGSLIVFEGPDRAGKTTQIELLASRLKESGKKVVVWKFPSRDSSSPIGSLLDSYLKKSNSMTKQSAHLLFSVDRWERKDEMVDLLFNGTTILADRFSMSGYAYSVAQGIDPTFCACTEIGLPIPDVTIYFRISVEELKKRGEFGNERFEKSGIQEKVICAFESIFEKDKSVIGIDATKSIPEVSDEIFKIISSKLGE